MKKRILNDQEIKDRELAILIHLKEVCEAHNLRYTLEGGTLLGAIRHKGFIPWDDDIDVSLPFPDYLKLMDYLENDTKFKLLYDMNTPGYFYWHAKLVDPHTVAYEVNRPKDNKMGIWVDIFPITGIPQNAPIRNYFSRMNQANSDVFDSIGLNYRFSPSLFRRFIKTIVRIPRMIKLKTIGEFALKKKRQAIQLEEPFDTAKQVGLVPTVYGERFVFDKNNYIQFTEVLFEGTLFKAIKNWDAHLRQIYGDYLTPPPIEKRGAQKHFVAYLIEE